MNKIIASRGMGKTQALINEAKLAIAEGKQVLFVTPNRSSHIILKNKCPSMELITFSELPYKIRGKRLDNIKILIDELDLCVNSLLCTTNWTYSYTIGG